jgi:hypothetical protein
MCCLSFTVFCQDGGRNTVTVGAGGGFPTGGELTSTFGVPDSAAFSASYEFRLFKYLAPEVGVVNMIPDVPETGGDGFPLPPARARVTLLSFGAHGILPLKQGRIELLAGAGGVHVFTTNNDEFLFFNAPRTIWQINGGGRIALDKRRHFWVGPTVRFSRDGGRPTQEWVSLTGDFGFRF